MQVANRGLGYPLHMEKNPEQRDPEAENRDQADDATEGQKDAPVDGPGGAEDGAGATSQDEPK